jgi:predicted phosphodiesterase
MELTTVADDFAVVHDGMDVRRYDELEPDHDYELDGFSFRTLARPGGAFLGAFATVNDVHFGEVICGLIDELDVGPTFSVGPDDEPYPELMNRGAIEEITAIDPLAVVVKGDLTSEGTVAEYERFRSFYEPAFGDRLHVVRGNHDSYHGGTFASEAPFDVTLPGVRLAVVDTALPHRANGGVSAATLAWLEDLAASTDRPILVFGHHHAWSPASASRPADYFGIVPDDSERLIDVFARHHELRGYFAGHTHRNRVRRFEATGEVPWVEVACVKDFPGTWAEYRVFEGGVLQVHHRISTPEAMAWTEKTRGMFAGEYFGYAFGALEDRCFPIATAG